jgi:ubiquinone/menaquinone biosynthesis C-methylase UbiE
MPDVYATIAEVDRATQERLAAILELRAADPQQRAMLDSHLATIPFPPRARVLEIGCGTGPVTRAVAGWSGVAEVVGLDPSPVFIARARELAAALDNAAFEEGDGRAVRFADGAFDVVLFHTALAHIPQPERALAEARRVLRADGVVAVCDADYTTASVALGASDPLQDCMEAVTAAFVNDPWLTRRLPALLRSAGFDLLRSRGHGYVQTAQPDYILSLVERGADTLAAWGRVSADLCAALKAEARQRAEAGAFYGFIGFVSVIARKPA